MALSPFNKQNYFLYRQISGLYSSPTQKILSNGKVINYVHNDNGDMTYDEAATWCFGLGGTLPVPTSDEENAFLHSLGNTWLGLTTNDITGSTYTYWHPDGEPTGDGIYIQLINTTPWDGVKWGGRWNDGSPVTKLGSSTCYIGKL